MSLIKKALEVYAGIFSVRIWLKLVKMATTFCFTVRRFCWKFERLFCLKMDCCQMEFVAEFNYLKPWTSYNKSFRKLQFVSNHTIRESVIFALRDNWVTNIIWVKIFFHKKVFLLYIRKNITWLSFGLCKIGQVFSVSFTIVLS